MIGHDWWIILSIWIYCFYPIFVFWDDRQKVLAIIRDCSVEAVMFLGQRIAKGFGWILLIWIVIIIDKFWAFPWYWYWYSSVMVVMVFLGGGTLLFFTVKNKLSAYEIWFDTFPLWEIDSLIEQEKWRALEATRIKGESGCESSTVNAIWDKAAATKLRFEERNRYSRGQVLCFGRSCFWYGCVGVILFLTLPQWDAAKGLVAELWFFKKHSWAANIGLVSIYFLLYLSISAAIFAVEDKLEKSAREIVIRIIRCGLIVQSKA